MKNEGVLAGVADLQVICRNKIFFVEMKIEKGRQNTNQKAFQEKINKLGFDYFICRSFQEFQNIVNNEIRK